MRGGHILFAESRAPGLVLVALALFAVNPSLFSRSDARGSEKDPVQSERPSKEGQKPEFKKAVLEPVDEETRDLLDEGARLRKARQYDKAIEKFDAALARLDEKTQPLRVADTFSDIALCYLRAGRAPAAVDPAKKALNIRRSVLGKEHSHTLNSMNALSQVLFRVGRSRESVDLMAETLAVSQRVFGEEDARTVIMTGNLGIVLSRRGRLSEAETLLGEALGVGRRIFGEEHSHVLTWEATLGNVRVDQGRLSEAETLYVKTLKTMRRVLGEENTNTIAHMGSVAELLRLQGKLSEAEGAAEEALGIARRFFGKDHPRTWRAWNHLASVRYAQGRHPEAEAIASRILDLQRSALGEDHSHTLKTKNDLSMVLEQQGRLSEAETLLVEALRAKRRVLGDEHPETLLGKSNLALLRHRQRRLSEAETLYREALEIQRRAGVGHPGTLALMNNLSALLGGQGRFPEAESLRVEMLKVQTRVLGDKHPRVVVSMNHLGSLQKLQGRLSEAEETVVKALRIGRRVLGGRSLIPIVVNLGGILEAQGKPRQAEAVYAEALSMIESLRGTVLGDERDRALYGGVLRLSSVASLLCRVLIDLGRPAEAFDVTERGRGRAFLDLLARSDRDLVEEALALGDQETAGNLGALLEAKRKAIVELRRAENLLSATRRRKDLVAEKKDIRLREQRAALRKAEEERRSAERKVLAAIREVRPDARPATRQEIRAVLQPGERILSYAWTKTSVTALLVPPSSAPGIEGLVLADGREAVSDLARLTAEFRSWTTHGESSLLRGAVDLTDKKPLARPTRALFDRLIPDPIRAEVKSATRLIILPDGPLSGISFESLVTSRSTSTERAQFLIDDGPAISYASSGTIYLNRRKAKKSRFQKEGGAYRPTAVILGDPVYDREKPKEALPDHGLLLTRGLEDLGAEASAMDQVRLHGGALRPLPGSAREARNIAAVFRTTGGGAKLLMREKATIASLADAVEGVRYLHLATHGLMGSRERPYEASLALTRPRKFTSEDIGFLTLDHLIRGWRAKLSECELVVLSACHTGVGVKAGDSMMALPWGFMYAGAPTVVASLWQVDDTATTLLMTRFYENLLGSLDGRRTVKGKKYPEGRAMSKSDALREAKLWLRSVSAEEVRKRLRITDEAEWRKVVGPNTLTGQGLFEHPYYWAAFVLLGDPG